MLKVNDKAPLFVLQDDQGGQFSLAEQAGQRLLLVFYPGDNTPVCTKQLCDYRDGVEAFAGLGVKVVGISNDSAESHRKFRQKYDLPFTLLSDPDLEVAALYDSKGMLGMKRSVFLLDEAGVIRYLHIESVALFRRKREELLEAIRKLS
ncbi:MAG: peroxiredoxin [Xanthomonadales bacterium]|jgi:peroxiredoxin Q/BCP|nr:peroxiredoxin [Xanthomonadales bacterium]